MLPAFLCLPPGCRSKLLLNFMRICGNLVPGKNPEPPLTVKAARALLHPKIESLRSSSWHRGSRPRGILPTSTPSAGVR